MLKRQFIFPNCASDENDDVADFFATFGINPDAESDDNSNEDTSQNIQVEEKQTETPEAEQNSEQEENSQKQQADPLKANNKANEAFAQLRVENKKYQNMIKGIATLLGVRSDNPDDIIGSVQKAITQAQAKQQGVPPEMLARMAKLEEDNRAFMQNEIRKNAYLGFQNLKDKFSLDNNSLNDFANVLVNDGLNPFETHVDLETEYIKRNYKNLMAQAEERGAKKEAERAARARNQGTSPSTTQGGEDNTGVEKITSVYDLDKWLNSQSK